MLSFLASSTATWQYVLGGVLIALSVALLVLILNQSGKETGLSSTLTGSADTYFGKSGGDQKERILSRLTIVGSVLFVIITIVLIILIKIGTEA